MRLDIEMEISNNFNDEMEIAGNDC